VHYLSLILRLLGRLSRPHSLLPIPSSSFPSLSRLESETWGDSFELFPWWNEVSGYRWPDCHQGKMEGDPRADKVGPPGPHVVTDLKSSREPRHTVDPWSTPNNLLLLTPECYPTQCLNQVCSFLRSSCLLLPYVQLPPCSFWHLFGFSMKPQDFELTNTHLQESTLSQWDQWFCL
jgi:hypothetical protein